MGSGESDAPRFRWWCAYCDHYSEEAFPSQRAAHEAGVAHIHQADHGLTTILTPPVEEPTTD